MYPSKASAASAVQMIQFITAIYPPTVTGDLVEDVARWVQQHQGRRRPFPCVVCDDQGHRAILGSPPSRPTSDVAGSAACRGDRPCSRRTRRSPDPASQPCPLARLAIFAETVACAARSDDKLRHDALLQAQAAVVVLLARHEAVDAWRAGDPHVLGPEPGEAGQFNRGGRLHHRTSPPAVAVRYLGSSRLRQPLRQQQPAVVGDDADLLPAGLQQRLDAMDQVWRAAPGCGGPADSLRRGRSCRVAVLGPRPARWVADCRRGEYLEARRRPAACGTGPSSGLCRPGDARPELFAGRHPSNLPATGETAGFAVGVTDGRATK